MRHRTVWIIARIVVPLVPAGVIAFIAWVFTRSTLPIWGGGVKTVLIPSVAAYVIISGLLWLVPDPEPRPSTDRAVALVLLVSVAIVPICLGLWLFGLVRTESHDPSCIVNLKRIEGAKSVWALDHKKKNEDLPSWIDLVGPAAYLQEMPHCPAGGRYTLCVVGEPPRCSISGHVLQWAYSSNQVVSGSPEE